jgi:hypothetical protein
LGVSFAKIHYTKWRPLMNPNNYGTLEACQRLVDAGIVLETDCWWQWSKEYGWRIYPAINPEVCEEIKYLPAPSMVEVWRELLSNNNVCLSGQQDGETTVWTYSGWKQTSPDISNINPTDALIDLLIWLTAQKEDQDE